MKPRLSFAAQPFAWLLKAPSLGKGAGRAREADISVRSRAVILSQVGFWFAACLVLAFLLWLFHAVLMPFVVALVLGYLLDPLVGRMERLRLGRGGATTVILVGSLVVAIVIVALFSPMLVRQVAGFIKALPDLVKRVQDLATAAGDQVTHGRVGELLNRYGLGGSVADIRSSAGDYVNKAVAWVAASGNSLLSRTAALLDLLSLAVITPVVTFYILLDWPRMLGALEALIPPRNRDTVHAIVHDIDRALAGFLRGQLLVCLFLAAWYGIGLTVIGLNFGLLIGLLGGILSFVPYVGSLMVLVLSLLIAIVQGWPSWHLPAFALGVVLIGQFLEGNVLSPKLVGDKVGLHPVWIIFALLGFGSVFGFTGLLVAVPVASALGVLLRYATRRYRESPIYTGEIATTQAALVPVPPPARLSGT